MQRQPARLTVWVLVAAVLHARVSATSARIRETLLEEAKKRLTSWYEDRSNLRLPYWSSKAKVQITKDDYWCDAPGGSDQVPVLFGEFNVTEARPVDVFNALADFAHQAVWDTTAKMFKPLGDYPENGVRGLQVVFPSGIIFVPDRQVIEWTAFNASKKDTEYWATFSSLENGQLLSNHAGEGSAVSLQNCLGAYWVRPCPKGGEPWSNCPSGNPTNCCPDGGARVLFTQHVNVYPPAPLNARNLFDASWYKTINWVNLLRGRAQQLRKEARDEEETVVPRWLLREAVGSAPVVDARALVHISFAPSEGQKVARLYDASKISVAVQHPSAALAPLLAFLLPAAGLFACRRLHGPRGHGQQVGAPGHGSPAREAAGPEAGEAAEEPPSQPRGGRQGCREALLHA